MENLCLETCDLHDFEILDITSSSLETLAIVSAINEPEGDGLLHCKLNISCPSLFSLRLVCPVVTDFSGNGLNSLQKVFIYIKPVYDRFSVEDGYVLCKMLQGVCSTRDLILGDAFADVVCVPTSHWLKY